MTETKTRRFGITLRIALLAWLITLITVSVFVTVIIPEQKRTFLENLESKASAVFFSVQDVAVSAVVNEDYGTLVDHCLEIVKGDKSIEYVVVTKNNGQSWIQKAKGFDTKQLSPDWHPEKRVPHGAISFVPEFNCRVFHYSQPLDYSGIEWGWIHVGLSLKAYDRSVAAVYRRTGILALICILLSLLASGFYARFLVKPILTLQTAVRRVAGGDLSARADIRTGDEVELLANSFNGMAGSLLQRDQILGSVRFAAQQFLSAPDWRTVSEEVLTRIGRAAGISRAYILENHIQADGSLFSIERFAYKPSAGTTLVQTPKLVNVAWLGSGSETIRDCLAQGRVFSGIVGQLSPAEQALIARREVRSILLVPVQIEGAWWGYLELDDCERERAWTEAEVDSLRALADMLGAAITRQRAQEALLEAKRTLELRVAERTQELQNQVVAKEKAHAELAATQQELIVASREAGMAEVATGVLHNVGNVLNSVNVSANLIRERLRRSELASFPKLRALLQQHESDMAAFLASDPRGKLVPGYVIQLSEQWEREQAALQEEHEQLARNVEHIKEIVAMQQNYARVSGFLEPVAIATLLEDALQMNTAGLTRHGITIVRQYSEVPELTVDKHKVLQILVNLVHNAKYALDGSRGQDKRLTVGLGINGDHKVKVTVADNGIGIPPENLTRIFAHGFSTRKGGHGFGLHSGANAAKEMGGQLTAHSEGLGKGATFVLEIPLAPPKAKS